ncbi:MAG: PilW family protein [Proteobacteria bacterium]|nr:PilW family protein [Pseudomonadota bacterium]
MNYLKKIFRTGLHYTGSNKGVTLVELMVVMGLTTIVLGVIYAAYHTQSRMNIKETAVVNMQQNIRGSLYLFEKDIRMAGYNPNPTATENFGIIDITDINGNSAITFTADIDGDGLVGSDTFYYQIYDYTSGSPVGILDLGRKKGASPGYTIVAESIDALGLAYAYDNDGDGQLDVSPSGFVLWAIDTDGNNKLDRILDTNDSGVIDLDDDEAGTALSSEIDLDKIRAIKVWILARTKTSLLQYMDSNTYVVANRHITPNDSYKRELLETTIKCRNLGFE